MSNTTVAALTLRVRLDERGTPGELDVPHFVFGGVSTLGNANDERFQRGWYQWCCSRSLWKISTVTPPTGPAAGSSPITIGGSGFQSGATVRIGGVPATNVAVASSTVITCRTPPGALGATDVRVDNPDTQFGVMTAGFTYVANLVVSGINPSVAPAGAVVTVTGSGMQPGLEVDVGGATAQVLAVSATTAMFTNPPSIRCNTTVLVTNPDNQSGGIAFNPAPAISALVVDHGPASGGTSVFILGGPYFAGTAVTIGGSAAALLGQSPSALLVVAPPGTPGPSMLVVSSVAGCTASAVFTYQ